VKECADIEDTKEKIMYISKVVAERYGGIRATLVEDTEDAIENIKNETGTNVVLLGEIPFGYCRHRSILFKVTLPVIFFC
jgi:serine/threonine-protein kinase CTR1